MTATTTTHSSIEALSAQYCTELLEQLREKLDYPEFFAALGAGNSLHPWQLAGQARFTDAEHDVRGALLDAARQVAEDSSASPMSAERSWIAARGNFGSNALDIHIQGIYGELWPNACGCA